MANPYLPIDPFRVPFQKGSTADRPIPPPGLDYDNQAREDLSAAYPATTQVTVITLGGTTLATETSILTITPVLMANGSPWPDELAPVSLTYTDPGTATLAGVGDGWTAAALATQTIVDLADLANFQRVLDLVTVSNVGGVVTLTGAQPGATFTYAITGTSAVNDSGGVTTTGAQPDPLGVGLIGVVDGYEANGTPIIALPDSGSVSGDILGIVRDSMHVREGEPADLLRYYKRPAPDVVYRPWGTGTVYAEGPVTRGAAVWVRNSGAAGDIIGAVAAADGGAHIAYTGATFMRDTTAAGPAAIIIPHP